MGHGYVVRLLCVLFLKLQRTGEYVGTHFTQTWDPVTSLKSSLLSLSAAITQDLRSKCVFDHDTLNCSNVQLAEKEELQVWQEVSRTDSDAYDGESERMNVTVMTEMTVIVNTSYKYKLGNSKWQD